MPPKSRGSIVLAIVTITALAAFGIPNRVVAQWSVDPDVNTPVCRVADDQSSPKAVSDGSGGVIVAWSDGRGTDNDIYAQRLDASGRMQWTQYSAAVAVTTGSQASVAVCADGSGGAIIAWVDARADYSVTDDTVAVYAQRINSSGTPLWTTNGVLVSSSTAKTSGPVLVGDGSGGAIIAWSNIPAGSATSSILVQRVSSAGAVQWTAGGVTLGFGADAQIVSDASAGAIVGWVQTNASEDIYARRVSSAGSPMWSPGGSPICNESGDQHRVQIVEDGSGGAILVWEDERNGSTDTDVYAQRVNSSGTQLWGADLAISSGYYYQSFPAIASDGNGGAVIGWADFRDSTSGKLAVQRVDAAGTLMWTPDGMFVCSADGSQWPVSLLNDGIGGIVAVWEDYRDCPGPICNDIYAQRVDTGGVVSWGLPGIPLTTIENITQESVSLVSDGSGGAIAVWQDERSGGIDIYAQNMSGSGYLGNAAPAIAAVEDVANDQGGEVTVMWNRSDWDVFPNSMIDEYIVWRGVRPDALAAGTAAVGTADDAGSPAAAPVLEAGEYFTRRLEGKLLPGTYLRLPSSAASGDTIYWQYLGQVNARWHTGYSYSVETSSDSGGEGIPWSYFMITANTSNPLVFWDSAPDSGYSVDNVAPEAVQSLSVEISSGGAAPASAWVSPTAGASGRSVETAASTIVICRWERNRTDPDVARYELHRSSEPGFLPTSLTLIDRTTDTSLVDGTPPEGVVSHYRVLAVDIHGNPGAPSDQAEAVIPANASYAVQDKWNLVSVPLIVEDYTATALFPTASSSAFGYANGYSNAAVLQNGAGYWLKFVGAQNVPLSGLYRHSDTVHLEAGWNLVGSVSEAVAVGDIGSNPPGLVTSQFFGYEGHYAIVATIEPGKGYWVKASQAGEIHLGPGAAATGGAGISIFPITEAPPPPPDGSRDESPAGDPAETAGIIPGAFALGQNYPNPFNPVTRISYDLPAGGRVLVRIFNTLGEVVATLVDEEQGPGRIALDYDAGALPSGVYYYRLDAGRFSSVRKMILLR